MSDIERLNALRRLNELKANNGLAAYRPHRKQGLFHSAAWAKFRYLRTGNRFGKSTCGAAEDCAFALGARLWLPKDDPNRTLGIPQRSSTGVILCADWDKAREIFTNPEPGRGQGKLYQLLPKASLIKAPRKNQAGEIDCIYVESLHGGTSTIYIDTIKSFKSNPMGQESSSWDWIHVDEPLPRDMWIANSRGLIDSNGSAWFTCTPISEQWINEMFVPAKRMRDEFPEGLGRKDKSMWIMTGSTTDNERLSKEGIQAFMNTLKDSEIACRIHGSPKSSAGLVYKEFDMERHVYETAPFGWKDIYTPPDNYTIRVSIDPHPRTPHAVLFAATAPTGQTFFYREYFSHVLIDDLCDAILDILKGRNPLSIICDPSAFNIDPVHGTCWADRFYAKGLMVGKAPKELTYGIVAVQQALTVTQGATLHFSADLSETLREFDTYVWDPKKENKPLDKDDHMMECLYRLVLCGLDYFDPNENTTKIISQPKDDKFDLTIPTRDSDERWMKSLARFN